MMGWIGKFTVVSYQLSVIVGAGLGNRLTIKTVDRESKPARTDVTL
ncbi:hypothetical protein [Chroococcidiopsis sp. CCNUC1]|nr:hypothetical protein [Chroococcidiopsis sp. CCNUC1]URD49862.1 hypothetical protein M5J74_26590 [Chroococcidiopsis sp. CCNUC1]